MAEIRGKRGLLRSRYVHVNMRPEVRAALHKTDPALLGVKLVQIVETLVIELVQGGIAPKKFLELSKARAKWVKDNVSKDYLEEEADAADAADNEEPF